MTPTYGTPIDNQYPEYGVYINSSLIPIINSTNLTVYTKTYDILFGPFVTYDI